MATSSFFLVTSCDALATSSFLLLVVVHLLLVANGDYLKKDILGSVPSYSETTVCGKSRRACPADARCQPEAASPLRSITRQVLG